MAVNRRDDSRADPKRRAHGSSQSAARHERHGAKSRAADLKAMQAERSLNLRQLFLKAHRGLNKRIAEKLIEKGYEKIRSRHITVYANIDLDGTRVSDLADRANLTIQGMGQLVSDLERLGYVYRENDMTDGRAKIVTFTTEGWKVMLASFSVLREIESELEAQLGRSDLNKLRDILTRLFPE